MCVGPGCGIGGSKTGYFWDNPAVLSGLGKLSFIGAEERDWYLGYQGIIRYNNGTAGFEGLHSVMLARSFKENKGIGGGIFENGDFNDRWTEYLVAGGMAIDEYNGIGVSAGLKQYNVEGVNPVLIAHLGYMRIINHGLRMDVILRNIKYLSVGIYKKFNVNANDISVYGCIDNLLGFPATNWSVWEIAPKPMVGCYYTMRNVTLQLNVRYLDGDGWPVSFGGAVALGKYTLSCMYEYVSNDIDNLLLRAEVIW